MVKTYNNTKKLKLDGYYYLSDKFGIWPIFIFENGILLKWTKVELRDSLLFENEFKDSELLSKIKSWKYSWGIYKIEDQKISVERWYPGEKPYDAFLEIGDILNDSTFHITTFSEPDGSCKEERDEVYRFKSFSPKPDSTNVFIK